MADSSIDDSASIGDDDPRRPQRNDDGYPEHLPPVQPPSAGFIVQLFLIPALIVMVVVGVWALFGRMASGEQDWHVLVTELRSNNEHRHWRAALGLAQLLEADRQRNSTGSRLTDDPELAQALTDLLQDKLGAGTNADDDIKQAAFLARTVGLMDAPTIVIPVLTDAIDPKYDREIRKNALGSISVIAGRAAETTGDSPTRTTLENTELSQQVIAATAPTGDEKDQLIQQLAAYTLGLLKTESAHERLEVLVSPNFERSTRVNAAVGLARQHSTAGLPVFREVLIGAVEPPADFSPQTAVSQELSKSSSQWWWGSLIAVAVVGLMAVVAVPKRTGMIAALTCCGLGLLVVGWRVSDRAQMLETRRTTTGVAPPSRRQTDEERRAALDQVFANHVAVKNSLKAVGDLSEELSTGERAEMETLIEPIADHYTEAEVRTEAARVLKVLAAS